MRKGGYDLSSPLSQEAKEDLEWWIWNLSLVNGRGLVREKPLISIESDASLTGWGAVCKDQSIGGPWGEGERHLHVNCLRASGGDVCRKRTKRMW